MGNELGHNAIPKPHGEDFAEFLKDRKKKQADNFERTDKYTFSPELVHRWVIKKWRSELVQSLETLSKDAAFANLCSDLIEVVKNLKM